MSAANKYKARQDASLKKAKASLANNDDEQALKHFKKACIFCECNRTLLHNCIKATRGNISDADVPLPSCHCRDIMDLDPDDDDKQAIYKLASKSCSCGSDLQPCHVPAHHDGLNGMAVVCGRKKAFKDACKYALLLILVAPHIPTGYMRLAKSLRLQDASKGTDTKKRWAWLYSQVRGIDPDKLKGLASVLRVDIISKAPPEIQQTILQHLSLLELCRCMRVSKSWNHASRNPTLWRHLEFIKRWPAPRSRPLPKGVLNDIISQRSQNLAQSLHFSGLFEFGISKSKLSSLLQGLPHLQMLSLHQIDPPMRGRYISRFLSDDHRFADFFQIICRDAPKGLRRLQLADFDWMDGCLHGAGAIPETINFATSLRELDLVDVEAPAIILHLMRSTQWPSLKKLHIVNTGRGTCQEVASLDLAEFFSVTPALKDLSLQNVGLHENDSERTLHYLSPMWKKLDRLSLSPPPRYFGSVFPELSALRSLELNGECREPILVYERRLAAEDIPIATLNQLEHFRFVGGFVGGFYIPRIPIEISSLILHMLKPKVPDAKARTLRSLDIDFVPDLGYDTYIDKKTIESLSCNDIKNPSIHPGGSPGNADVFLEWLDGFPNLTTLGIFPEMAEHAWMIVAKAIRRLDEKSRVERIYTNVLKGVYRDEIIELAGKKGIQIIHADRVPPPELSPLPHEEVAS